MDVTTAFPPTHWKLSRSTDESSSPSPVSQIMRSRVKVSPAVTGAFEESQPVAPPADARLAPGRARGEALFRQRMGQLDLSCAQCHDANAGRRLAGSVIPQGHPTGYPIYRLEWQSVGSLARRIRGCMTGVRAEPFGDDAPETVDLELYLKQRAAGLPVETPAVRP